MRDVWTVEADKIALLISVLSYVRMNGITLAGEESACHQSNWNKSCRYVLYWNKAKRDSDSDSDCASLPRCVIIAKYVNMYRTLRL